MYKINILLVDDRPEGLVTLASVLDDPEYNLITADSGQKALAQVLHNDFAVILMDVQMPEMDGFETTAIIKQRERSKNIPIIFMTANNKADHYISIGYSVGAVDYILKPFDSHILKSKVAVFVDLYKKNRLLQQQTEVLQELERRDRLRAIHNMEVEGRRRYQNLADAIPQIVFRSNNAGEIEYFNQFWLRYTGKTLDESMGMHWQSSVHPKDLPEIKKNWDESQHTQMGFECECRLRHDESGIFRWHLLRVVPEFNQVSELVSWIGVATDIHDQKLTQEELIFAKKMADAASETKSNFLANMSHEIRTPLGVILGFSELLSAEGTTAEEKLNAISVIRRNGDQLSKIIDEILDLSKVEAGKMDFDRSEVSVIDLLHSIREFMSLPAQEKGLDLQFQLKGLVPTKIFSNATRIQQILVNLIGNAIKFTPQGKIAVTTWHQPKTNASPDMLCFSVKDSGPGLSAEQIKKLFQPFNQIDTSMTRKHGGTGLGLALSRRLARALNGDVVVKESKPGDGCEFIVSIHTGDLKEVPFTKTMQVAKKTEALQEKQDHVALDGVSILLVEDSEDNQALFSRFLTLEGAKVELANNGAEGVDKAFKGDHDVILMDIQMPVLDGYGAITSLRQKGFDKPIIALTAHGMKEDRQRCLEAGASDYLTKPVNRVALIKQVQELSGHF